MRNGLDLISVIIPVFKVEKYLDRCIASVVEQSYTNLEIILVDDGSPDRSPQLCDEWSLRDPRIKVIHQTNMGVSAARNTGLRAAGGDYLYFVDSDDWISPTLCEKTMNIFATNNVDIVVFDCNKITESGNSLGGTEKIEEGILSVEDSLKALLQGHLNSYSCNKVFKRAVFDNIWFPDRSAFEDMAIAYKLFLNAAHIYYLNEQLYFYYQRSDSATGVIDAKKLGELFLSRWESYEYLKPLYPDVAEIALQRTAWSALLLYNMSLRDKVNEDIYATAMTFLKTNKDRIMWKEHSLTFWLFYTFPVIYRAIRYCRRMVGNIVRTIRRKKCA